jgi:hypothetical protein
MDTTGLEGDACVVRVVRSREVVCWYSGVDREHWQWNRTGRVDVLFGHSGPGSGGVFEEASGFVGGGVRVWVIQTDSVTIKLRLL